MCVCVDQCVGDQVEKACLCAFVHSYTGINIRIMDMQKSKC